MKLGRVALARVFTKGRSLEDLQRLRARSAQPPPFGRSPPNERVLSASEVVKFDLPVSLLPDSPSVKKSFPKFGDGFGVDSPERYAEAVININEICDANAIGNGPGRHAIALQLLRGSAKRNYEAYLRDLGNMTVANVNEAIKQLGVQIFGRNFRARQRDFLTSVSFKKARGVSVQNHANRLSDIETKFEAVMGAGSLGLDEEMKKDCFLKSMPLAFQADFYTQPRELADVSLTELVAMFVRFEAAHEIMSSALGVDATEDSLHTSMPGRGAMRSAATRRGARGSGRLFPPQRQTGARRLDRNSSYRDSGRDAIQREAANAVPPGMVQPVMRRPYFQNVYRTTGPRAYVNRELQDRYERRLQRQNRGNHRNGNGARNNGNREANVIERQPNPQGADSDVGF